MKNTWLDRHEERTWESNWTCRAQSFAVPYLDGSDWRVRIAEFRANKRPRSMSIDRFLSMCDFAPDCGYRAFSSFWDVSEDGMAVRVEYRYAPESYFDGPTMRVHFDDYLEWLAELKARTAAIFPVV
jgi:hypothetical protein